jgi:hypothetical protein
VSCAGFSGPEPDPAKRGKTVQQTRPGYAGRRGAGAFVKRQTFIAALVATAALVFSGAALASTADSSPPAPLRAAASPRHSAASASATATHAARARHGHRHHRRLNAEKAQFRARVPWSGTGAFPPQPVRHSFPSRHAALRPASHDRPHARTRNSGQGAAALASRIGTSPDAGRFDEHGGDTVASRIESLSRGRGPPRAPPFARSPRSSDLDAFTPPTYHPIPTQDSRSAPGRSLSAPVVARRGPRFVVSPLSRDRLEIECRPHVDRLEGAVACFGMPSSRRPS